MLSETFRTIRVERAEGVATITLDRPDRLNAYTTEMGNEIFGALAALDEDDGVRAIVITGAGRAFCAGADLEPAASTFSGGRRFEATREAERKALPWNLRTPILAAINGPAVGIGATLPLQWDIRIASERAKIGFVFTRRGIVAEAHSTWILPRLVGFATAMDLMLTGRVLTADEALRVGLVSRVVPHDDLLPTARAMALEIARSTSPVAVALTKRLLWRQLMETDPRRAKAVEDEIFYWAGAQADSAEGVTAFLEKRPPAWKVSKSSELPAELDPLD
jgi:enoyl-CoA hydratase/carnithine racemase